MNTSINVILHALTSIRAQILAYHQMRSQSVVFISGLGVAVAGLALSHGKDAPWTWIAFAGPMTFMALALFLSMYFRRLLDVCQSIETSLLQELRTALASSETATLQEHSAVYYDAAIKNKTNIAGERIKMKLWRDETQHALIVYIVAYLLFWVIWYRPWRLVSG